MKQNHFKKEVVQVTKQVARFTISTDYSNRLERQLNRMWCCCCC